MRRLLLLLTIVFLAACGKDKSVDDYLVAARDYYDAGDFPAARIELLNAMHIRPGLAEARFLLGKIYLEMDENADAEKELTRAESLEWPAGQTRPRIARALLGQAKLEEVLALSTEGLPPVPAARVMAVQVLAALLESKSIAAQALFDGAMELAPEDIEIRLLGARMDALRGRLENGLAEVDTVLADTPEYPDALRLRAHILLQMERLEEARDAFTATIEHSRSNFTDRIARATVNIRLDQLDEVRADLAELERADPGHPSVRYIRGLVAFHEGNARVALQSLHDAQPAARKYPLILYYLSLAHLLDGDLGRAKGFARELVEQAPDTVRGRRLLAALLLKNGDYEEVEPVLQPLRDFNPNDVYAMNLAAHALLMQDAADQAMFLFRRLARLFPDTPPGDIPLGGGLLDTSVGTALAADVEAALAGFPAFPRDDILAIAGQLDAQDYEAALATADSLKWRDTSGIAPYNVIASVHIAAGQIEQAREVLELALKREPGNASANMALAGLARRDKDNKRERQHLRAVLTADPSNLPAQLSLAMLDGREGDMFAMRAGLRLVMDRNPLALEPRLGLARYYLDSGEPQRVAAMFEGLLVLQQRSPRVLDLFARAELAQGKYGGAYAALTELTRTAGGTASQYYLLAGSADALGKTEESVAALEQALALDAGFVPARLALARRAQSDGNEAAFATQVERLIELAPEEPEVIRMQSALAAGRGHNAEALQLARRAHSAAETTATLLQLVEMQRRTGRLKRARTTLSNWLEQHPEDVPARLSLSGQLYAENKLQAAKQQYARVLALDPDNVPALNNLAWLLRNSDPKRSLGYIRRAANLMPDDPSVLDSRAVIEHLNGKNRAAIAIIKQALQVAPDDPSMRYHHAMIQNALGRTRAARAELEEILGDESTYFPEQEEARALLDSLSDSPAGAQRVLKMPPSDAMVSPTM